MLLGRLKREVVASMPIRYPSHSPILKYMWVTRFLLVFCSCLLGLEQFGSSWNAFWKNFKAFASIMEAFSKHFRSILDTFGNIFQSFGSMLETFGSIWNHSEAFGSVLKHFGRIWNILETFGRILKSFEINLEAAR